MPHSGELGRPVDWIAESEAGKRGPSGDDLGAVKRGLRMADSAGVHEVCDSMRPLTDRSHPPVLVPNRKVAHEDHGVGRGRPARRFNPDHEQLDRPAAGLGTILEDRQVATGDLEDDDLGHIARARDSVEMRTKGRGRRGRRRRARGRRGFGGMARAGRRRLGRSARPDDQSCHQADRSEVPRPAHVRASEST